MLGVALIMNSALAIGFTPYVISIKRTNIVWSSLMGKLIFSESLGRIKIAGLITIFLGIVLIITLG